MAVLCPDHSLLFIQAPRTGCTAIEDGVLKPHLGGRRLPAYDKLNERGEVVVDAKHVRLDELLTHGYLTPEQRRGLLVFSTVRNPFDSIVSEYLKQRHDCVPLLADKSSWVYKVPGYLQQMDIAATSTFPEWLRQRTGKLGRARPIARRLIRRMGYRPRPQHFEGVDVVMRYERLQEDFDAVLAQVGVEPIQIPRINVTQGRGGADYRTFYDDWSRTFVKLAYADHLRRFGYRF